MLKYPQETQKEVPTMDAIIQNLLAGSFGQGNIFPFLWVHGEPEAVIREYMEAVYNASIRAVCVESRPHPDFAGPSWWRDMDIILDEARKRGMKVWILDDSHFPTGYANGAVEKEPQELSRQFILRKELGRVEEGAGFSVSYKDCAALPEWTQNQMEQYMMDMNTVRKFDDDRLLGVVAVPEDGSQAMALDQDSEGFVLPPRQGAPACTVYSLILTRNRGPHRSYINMLDQDSCRILLDAVYEPHWQHYKEDFGKTIAGFFSDEPELGNGHLYAGGRRIWEEEDLPWSGGLETALRERWGGSFLANLPLLWGEDSSAQAAQVRWDYMNAVTRAVEQSFSQQIGGWCREHGVEYIGHLIEDNNQHTRTACGLGHYFRGLSGQDMAGIDDIGGQVLPQGEAVSAKGLTGETRNGPFFHYVLGKLGASLAAIDPLKKGRCMCEVFGAYGWAEGVKLEKYLLDHFLIRGVNRFVPHAFSLRDYPDPDCPPHFYAHGHNPQYRHFGALMRYAGRVTELISGGAHVPDAAILYPAEGDWAGEAMALETVAQPLYDRQIDFDFIPADVFTQRDKYRTKMEGGFSVNGQRYRALVVPGCGYISPGAAEALEELEAAGCPVLITGPYPANVKPGFPHIAPEELAGALAERGVPQVRVSPGNDRLRVLHYAAETHRYLLVNEGLEIYKGTLHVPSTGPCYSYNAWDNRLEAAAFAPVEEGTEVQIAVEPGKPLILVFDKPDTPLAQPLTPVGEEAVLADWARSTCTALEYPNFADEKAVQLPDGLAEEQPVFSGFVRYERGLDWQKPGAPCLLEITEAYEGVELFVNGVSLGIQVAAPFRYDLTDCLRLGANQLRIEAATTLERENSVNRDPMMALMGFGAPDPTCPSGISGIVKLYG